MKSKNVDFSSILGETNRRKTCFALLFSDLLEKKAKIKMKIILVYFWNHFLGKKCLCWIHVCVVMHILFNSSYLWFDKYWRNNSLRLERCKQDDNWQPKFDSSSSSIFLLLLYLFTLPGLMGFHFYNWLILNSIALFSVLDKLLV